MIASSESFPAEMTRETISSLYERADSSKRGSSISSIRSLTFFFQVDRRFNGSFFPRNFQQFGIELNEGMFNGGVLVVAVPAIILAWSHRTCCFRGVVETEISPLIRKPRLIFYLDVQSHQRFLIAPFLIDRAVGG